MYAADGLQACRVNDFFIVFDFKATKAAPTVLKVCNLVVNIKLLLSLSLKGDTIMATKKTENKNTFRWPKKLSKAGEYLKAGKPFMKLETDEKFMRLVMK